MPTRQLLSHLARLRKCEASFADSDLPGQPQRADYDQISHVYFKEDPRWQEQWQNVKRILAGREHLPRPAERRRASLQRKRTRQPRKRG
ncbi:MAG TPA: hypothetical protein VIA18_01975 [Polyangia bacterium]|nr:hypothetical protein [Polyangia bacterium]